MGRLAKTGLALVGLAAIGGFVSLLGGPNVFSTFSNAISTILPESEVAVRETKEEKKQEDIPTPPVVEEIKSDKVGVETPILEAQEAVPAPQVAPQAVPLISPKAEEPAKIPKAPASSPVVVEETSPKSVTKSTKSLQASASGGQEFGAPSRTQGSGSDGSGV